MAEPLPDVSNTAAERDAEAGDAAAALEKSADLPFFDLDIALIRRGQVAPTPKPAPAPTKAATVAPTLPSREQQALAALEALIKISAAPSPITQLPVQPAVSFSEPVLAAEPAAKYIMPTIMPVPATSQARVDFVQPGFERMAPITPAATMPTAEPDRLSQITAALLKSAFEVTSRAPDLRAELQAAPRLAVKFQTLTSAIAARETKLYQMAQTAPAAIPAPVTSRADSLTDDTPDDLPWGHVTYRLMVM